MVDAQAVCSYEACRGQAEEGSRSKILCGSHRTGVALRARAGTALWGDQEDLWPRMRLAFLWPCLFGQRIHRCDVLIGRRMVFSLPQAWH